MFEEEEEEEEGEGERGYWWRGKGGMSKVLAAKKRRGEMLCTRSSWIEQSDNLLP